MAAESHASLIYVQVAQSPACIEKLYLLFRRRVTEGYWVLFFFADKERPRISFEAY